VQDGEAEADGEGREMWDRGAEGSESEDGRDSGTGGKAPEHDLPRGGEEPIQAWREVSSRESAGEDKREKKAIEEEPKDHGGAMEKSGGTTKAGMESRANQWALKEKRENENQPRKNLSICVGR